MFKAFLVALFIKPIKLNTNPYFYNIYNLCLASILILVLVRCNDDNLIKNTTTIKKDSVSIWIEQSTDRRFSLDVRKSGLNKAYEASKTVSNDSLRLKSFYDIAYEAEGLNYDELFTKVNKSLLLLSSEKNDHKTIGEAHWNYGLYYTKKEKIDSSYYHYHKAF